MGAKVVYKAHVQRVSGRVDTLTPHGAPGWVALADCEAAVASVLAGPEGKDVCKVVVTEERVLREYNGPAQGKPKGAARDTTLF